MSNDEEYAPIQNFGAIDVWGVRKGGGADLFIVVSQYLRGDPASQKLLLDKLEEYFGFINGTDFAAECGAPTPDTTCVIVKCQEEPDPLIRELVENSKPWADENNTSVRLEVA